MTICNMSIEARRAGRADRARRDDVRVSRGPARARRGVRRGRRRSRSGARLRPTTARSSTGRSRSTWTRCRRRSRGARTRGWSPMCAASSRIRPSSPTRPRGRRPSVRSSTWGSSPGTPIREIELDRVFIGSCTNARLEDLRAAARVVEGKHVAGRVTAIVVPGSAVIRRQAEEEGLDRVFTAAGFEWRRAGCSMCLGMNDDVAGAGRAGRVDVEPELRRSPGCRRADASRVARDGGRRRDRRATSSTCGRCCRYEAADAGDRPGRDSRPPERRHRSDHPEAVPEADRALGLRRVSLLRLDARSRLRAAPAGGRRERRS